MLKEKRDLFETFVTVCAIIVPFTTLPQLYTIYIDKQADGVSALTWLLYALLTVPLFFYAKRKKDKPMIILNGLWVIFEILVSVGVVFVAA